MIDIIDKGRIFIDCKGSKKKGWTSWMAIELQPNDYEQFINEIKEECPCLLSILKQHGIQVYKAED